MGTRLNTAKYLRQNLYVKKKHAFYINIFSPKFSLGARGGVVIEALRYKPKGRGFDSRWCHWIFSLT
jgi:hypothetical protein